MKISIITPTLNSDKTIAHTLFSVFLQTYKNIEHIIVDGGSTDQTLNIIKQHKYKIKIFSYKNSSIYEAINLGIKKSTGDYVLILNSDDILDNSNTIKKIVEIIIRNKKNIIIFGAVNYFRNDKFNIFFRSYPAISFRTWMLRFGNMPPHPGAFIPKDIAKKFIYDSKLMIASDFDFFLKVFIKKFNYKLVKNNIVRMRAGGVSNRDLYSHVISSAEILKSLHKNNVYSNIIFVYLRFLLKINQLIFVKKNNLKYRINKYYENFLNYDFNILNKIKVLNFNKNFVLSGLNLAFLGGLAAKEVSLYKELIHWPDGLFAKKISPGISKIPGKELLEKLKLNNNIKRIVILGNLNCKSKIYLQKRFNKPIINYELPYGNIKIIIKKFNFKLKKNDLCFITLPTPKQEQLAQHMILKIKKFKIICIGGSINIASGAERAVPNFLKKIEFLWRLRYDTKRRVNRLLKTFYYYLVGRYIFRIYQNKNFQILK
jgi:glycosyltransferase involved in cell wall biosynthesis